MSVPGQEEDGLNWGMGIGRRVSVAEPLFIAWSNLESDALRVGGEAIKA